MTHNNRCAICGEISSELYVALTEEIVRFPGIYSHHCAYKEVCPRCYFIYSRNGVVHYEQNYDTDQ